MGHYLNKHRNDTLMLTTEDKVFANSIRIRTSLVTHQCHILAVRASGQFQ